MVAPDPDRFAKAVQVWSGVGVLPRRTLMFRLVPFGRSLVQVAVPQVTLLPASKTRDRNVPDAA